MSERSTGPAPGAAGSPPGEAGSEEEASAYASYLLGVLVLVYVFNFLDRQILSILNEDIKADLGLSDAQMGYLYGTVFAVFYAVFGIPLGRLADVWNRRSLIALGLGFWSAMTALSGLARGFGQLAAARIGVGVGEASASPAAFSMLSDSFPTRVRATVLAIYSSGIYIGSGLGMLVGGQVVERWNRAYSEVPPPFGLAGWQVAFMSVGLPGLALALWVRTLREPVRGRMDGLPSERHPHPFRAFGAELRSVIPPLTLWNLARLAPGGASLRQNLALAAAIALVAWGLTRATGDLAQWLSLGIGAYAAVSWVQALRLRDRPTAELVLHTPSLRYVSLGLAFLAFTGYGLGYWTAPFFLRHHDVGAAELGTILGATAAAGGFVGVAGGGFVADRLRARRVTGRLWVAIGAAVLPLPLGAWLLYTDSLTTAYLINFPLNVLTSAWIGVGASTVQDGVLPRMRAAASAFYLLLLTFIGLALGPYTVGKLSDGLGDLRLAMLLAFVANGAALALLALGMRHLAADEASLRERARAAGEAGL